MTTPTLAERLAEIAQLIRDADVRDPNFREAMIWMHRILTRLGDEDVVEAAAEAIANERGMRRGAPKITNLMAMLPDKLKRDVREDSSAALSAALSAAMAMEE